MALQRYADAPGRVRALAWASIGLGLAQLAAPRRMSRLIGARPAPTTLRAVGAREIASGVGLLRGPVPTSWLNARLVGDAFDLSALALARTTNARRRRIALAAVAGIAALDLFVRRTLPSPRLRLHHALVINRPAATLYAFWRDPRNLPDVLKNIDEVMAIDERRWHWVARGPLDKRIAWDAEIVDDQPQQMIAWRAVPGSFINTEGAIWFEPLPNNRGTRVVLDMHFQAPGAILTDMLGKLTGDAPSQQVYEALRRFKQIMETGEVATTLGQASGQRKPSVILASERARQA